MGIGISWKLAGQVAVQLTRLITVAILARFLTPSDYGTAAVAIPSLDGILSYLRGQIRPGDVVLTMGAGDVTKLSEGLLAGRLPEACAR